MFLKYILAFDKRRKICDIHLSNKSKQKTAHESDNSTRDNMKGAPKDQTLVDIVDNICDDQVNEYSSLHTMELCEVKQPNESEKEIRLDHSFENEISLTQKEINEISIVQKDKLNEEDELNQIEKEKQQDFIKNCTLSPQKLKVVIGLFQVYTMVHSKNPLDFRNLLSIWSAYH